MKNGYRVMIIQSLEIFALWGYFQRLPYLTLGTLFHRPVDQIDYHHCRLFQRTNTLSHWLDAINSLKSRLFGMSLVNHVMPLYCWRTQWTWLIVSFDSILIIYVVNKINAIQTWL